MSDSEKSTCIPRTTSDAPLGASSHAGDAPGPSRPDRASRTPARGEARAASGGIAWAVALVTLVAAGAACNGPPDAEYDQTPLYRSPADEGPTSAERGNVAITEINFAGSVTDDGTHDWDDVFIELRNNGERPVDVSEWRLQTRGDVSETYRIPESDPIPANEFMVIARKTNGAFGEVADATIPDLELGRKHVEVSLHDADSRLVGSVGSAEKRVFAGGWDTVTVRSMERVQLLFDNPGRKSRAWHAYSSNRGFETVREGYRERTLASPGAANSRSYAGSTASGNFE